MKIKIILLIILFISTSFLRVAVSNLNAERDYRPLASSLADLADWSVLSSNDLDIKIIDWLELDDYIFANYKNSGDLVSLYIGYYYSSKKVGAAHHPLVCYQGQGWNIQDNVTGEYRFPDNSGLAINYSMMTVERNNRKELIIYWFQSYDSTSRGTLFQKIKLSFHSLFNHKTDNAFVRISAPLKDGTVDEARRVIFDFIQSFYPVFLDFVQDEVASS